jgi:hypothetical protein
VSAHMQVAEACKLQAADRHKGGRRAGRGQKLGACTHLSKSSSSFPSKLCWSTAWEGGVCPEMHRCKWVTLPQSISVSSYSKQALQKKNALLHYCLLPTCKNVHRTHCAKERTEVLPKRRQEAPRTACASSARLCWPAVRIRASQQCKVELASSASVSSHASACSRARWTNSTVPSFTHLVRPLVPQCILEHLDHLLE